MSLRPFAVLSLVLALAAPSWAQEQRGTLEGVVRDSSGLVLPGATVEAKNDMTTVVVTSVTDEQGVFRFPSVPPGTYTVTVSLQGFQARTASEVRVGLGQVKKVDFSMPLSGVTESVQVTAETPLVDVRSTSRQANIRAEQVELLPKGRDFTTLVTQAPGANQESKLGGLSIDGASAGENRYIIDGIETTNLRNGTSGANLIADFVEEVQVKSSGYTAEYGGATGGVINAVTKSGTNDWHGSLLFNFQSSDLAGARRPTLRQNLVNSDIAEYISYPKDEESHMEPGFTIGGPIARNRAWFFAAYLPVIETVTRSVDPSTAGNPAASSTSVEQKNPAQNFTGNMTAQISNSLRGRVAYNNSWRKADGLLPSLTGTDPAGTNYSKASAFPTSSVSGNLDWVASSRLFLGVRGGYYSSDQNDSNVTEIPRVLFSTGNNLAYPEVPADLKHGTGFSNIPSNNKVTRDQQTRLYFQADGTHPSERGRQKVASQLMQFFKTSPSSRGWFLADSSEETPEPAEPTPPAGTSAAVTPPVATPGSGAARVHLPLLLAVLDAVAAP